MEAISHKVDFMLTVLLATRNRAKILRDVLENFCNLQSPPSGWKLVVIDNGSTDDTPRVLASFRDRLPIQSAAEPMPGKNAALNAGLELLEGDLAVFTDDDVFPRSDWLVQLRRAAEANPDYTMFGGAIRPRWEAPPPRWVNWIELGPIFTITDPGLKEGPLNGLLVTLIQGPNMAIRSSVFEKGTRLDTSIGPNGPDYPMGAETELVLRLGREGYKGWHVPAAVVEHLVRKEQLEEDWVLQRGIRWGRGCHRLYPNVKLWGSIPRHLFRDIPKEMLSVLAARLTFRQEALFCARWRLNILRGKWIESRHIAREKMHMSSSQALSR